MIQFLCLIGRIFYGSAIVTVGHLTLNEKLIDRGFQKFYG